MNLKMRLFLSMFAFASMVGMDSAFATAMMSDPQTLAQYCTPNSPMLNSDLCWGQVYGGGDLYSQQMLGPSNYQNIQMLMQMMGGAGYGGMGGMGSMGTMGMVDPMMMNAMMYQGGLYTGGMSFMAPAGYQNYGGAGQGLR